MHDVDDVEIADEFVEDVEYDGRTPLDKTIDRIGMGAQSLSASSSMLIRLLAPGSYQWRLLSLCGFGEHLLCAITSLMFIRCSQSIGWMADNVSLPLNNPRRL